MWFKFDVNIITGSGVEITFIYKGFQIQKSKKNLYVGTGAY